MITSQILNKAIQTYKTNIDAAITTALTITLPTPVTFSINSYNLNPSQIAQLAGQIVTGQRQCDKGSEFIYMFQISPQNRIPTQRILDIFNVSKQTNERLCQINESHAGTSTLYIGRTYTPRERLKKHLGVCNAKSPYAIHLSTWANGINLQLEFCLYQFGNSNTYSTQVIEDGLWDTLKPLLGKRGER